MTESSEPVIHEVEGNHVSACERCPALVKSRRSIINGRGPAQADILFLAEKPGQYDDQRGRAFSGDDGKVLAALMLEAGIGPTEVYTTYAVKCWPLANRELKAPEVRACAEHLQADIEAVKPKVIVTLGAKAFNTIYKGIWSGHIGQSLPYKYNGGECVVIPTFAPGFLLRGNWGLVPLVEAHLAKAKAISIGQLDAQPLEEAQQGWLTCDTVESVKTLKEFLLTADCITIDSETTGLNWMEDEILCLSFSALFANAKGVLEPCRMGFTVPILSKRDKEDKDCPVTPWWTEDEWDFVIEAIDDILACDIAKAIQNAGFDVPMFERDSLVDECLNPDLQTAFGWEVKNLRYDPYLLQRVVDENLPANETVMLGLYTDMPYYEAGIKEASKEKHHMELAPDAMLHEYAAGDGDSVARLLPPLIRRAQKQGVMWIHDNISIPMLRATWNMRRRGVLVDMEYFELLAARYTEIVSEARAMCVKAAGQDVNPNAPKQVANILFSVLGLPESGRKTKAAKECWDCQSPEGVCDKHDSTGKDALLDIKQMLIDKGEEPHPFIDAMITYRELSKRKSTYVDGGKGDGGIRQFIRSDECVHPEYGVNKADTGRLSATKPPIQTIPKKVKDAVLEEKDSLRRMFIARPGTFLLEADWNQGEVWVVAYESGDEKLLELLLSGKDVHTYVARTLCHLGSRVFPKDSEEPELSDFEWAQKYDTLRTKAKVFVFGLDYGMTEVGAAQRLGCPTEDAGKLIELFLSVVFPGLRAHFDRVRKAMEEDGFLTNRFGRKGHFGDHLFIKQWGGRRGMMAWEEKFRKGVNMPIQSGLNDLHMLCQTAMEANEALMARWPIITAIHDSCIGNTINDDVDFTVETAWMVKELMETKARHQVLADGTTLGWEIPVELKWGRSWGKLDWTLTPAGIVIPPKEG